METLTAPRRRTPRRDLPRPAPLFKDYKPPEQGNRQIDRYRLDDEPQHGTVKHRVHTERPPRRQQPEDLNNKGIDTWHGDHTYEPAPASRPSTEPPFIR